MTRSYCRKCELSFLVHGCCSSVFPSKITSCTHGSPTRRAPALLWYSSAQSVINFRLVRDVTTRILRVSQTYLEFESINAAYGAKHNGPSGTTITILPWSKSAMGPKMIKYKFVKHLPWSARNQIVACLIFHLPGLYLCPSPMRDLYVWHFSHPISSRAVCIREWK